MDIILASKCMARNNYGDICILYDKDSNSFFKKYFKNFLRQYRIRKANKKIKNEIKDLLNSERYFRSFYLYSQLVFLKDNISSSYDLLAKNKMLTKAFKNESDSLSITTYSLSSSKDITISGSIHIDTDKYYKFDFSFKKVTSNIDSILQYNISMYDCDGTKIKDISTNGDIIINKMDIDINHDLSIILKHILYIFSCVIIDNILVNDKL